MKKRTKKLTLDRQSIAVLERPVLERAAGGMIHYANQTADCMPSLCGCTGCG